VAVTRHRRHGTAQRSDRIQHSIYQDQQHWYTSGLPTHQQLLPTFSPISLEATTANSIPTFICDCVVRAYCSSASHSPRPVVSCLAAHSRTSWIFKQIKWRGFNPIIHGYSFLVYFFSAFGPSNFPWNFSIHIVNRLQYKLNLHYRFFSSRLFPGSWRWAQIFNEKFKPHLSYRAKAETVTRLQISTYRSPKQRAFRYVWNSNKELSAVRSGKRIKMLLWIFYSPSVGEMPAKL